MRLVVRFAYLVLFLSLARWTVPGIAAGVRTAIELWPLDIEARRLVMFGTFYEGVRRIDAALDPDERVAIIVDGHGGTAIFLNYYLYPQRTKMYADFASYRIDANRPEHLIRLDGQPRLLSYGEFRAEEVGESHVVKNLTLPTESRQSFIIPLAASGDGYPPDRWTTEGIIRNASDREARVTLQFPPARREATITLKPGETRIWNDVVYQLFGVLDQGWLDVQSDQPLFARFWFVNRATGDADLLPFARFGHEFEFPHQTGSRIWLINPYDRELPLRLNGDGNHGVPPMNIVPIEWIGDIRIESEADMFAFQSWRTETCCTEFRWPEERK